MKAIYEWKFDKGKLKNVRLQIAFVVTTKVEYEAVTSSVYIAGVHMIFGPKKVIKFGKHADEVRSTGRATNGNNFNDKRSLATSGDMKQRSQKEC